MKIRYLGPSPEVNVGGFGPHMQNEVKDYPGSVGEELLATCRKQRFELVAEEKEAADQGTGAAQTTGQDPAEMTVAQLKGDLGVFYSDAEIKGLKKDALVALYISTRDALIDLAGA